MMDAASMETKFHASILWQRGENQKIQIILYWCFDVMNTENGCWTEKWHIINVEYNPEIEEISEKNFPSH
jgi:hypothetical protein